MTTLAPAALRWLAAQWESAIRSASCSGIVGDARHAASGGYHISRDDLYAAGMGGDYSIAQFSDDRLGRGDLAAAIDMTMGDADMQLVTGRLAAAWRREDPRLANVRGFNGTVDGQSARRWDAANSDPNATDDATPDHLWHIHLEVYRRYADDQQTMRDILAVVIGGGAVPAAQEDGMPGEADAAFGQRYTGVESWVRGDSWMAQAIEGPLRRMAGDVATIKARPPTSAALSDADRAAIVAGLVQAVGAELAELHQAVAEIRQTQVAILDAQAAVAAQTHSPDVPA